MDDRPQEILGIFCYLAMCVSRILTCGCPYYSGDKLVAPMRDAGREEYPGCENWRRILSRRAIGSAKTHPQPVIHIITMKKDLSDDLFKQLEDPEWNRMYELKQAERPHKPPANCPFDDNLLTKEHYADLVGLLNRPEPAVAADAARQLCRGHIGDSRAISLIVRRFPSLQAENEASGFPLGNLQIRRNANPDLLRLLSSQNGDVRFRATKALVHSCDPTLAPHGEKLLKDPDERVRKAAEEMMKNVNAPIPADVPICLEYGVENSIDALLRGDASR